MWWLWLHSPSRCSIVGVIVKDSFTQSVFPIFHYLHQWKGHSQRWLEPKLALTFIAQKERREKFAASKVAVLFGQHLNATLQFQLFQCLLHSVRKIHTTAWQIQCRCKWEGLWLIWTMSSMLCIPWKHLINSTVQYQHQIKSKSSFSVTCTIIHSTT